MSNTQMTIKKAFFANPLKYSIIAFSITTSFNTLAQTQVIHAGTLLQVAGETPLSKQTLVIEDGKINLDHHLLANPVSEALGHVLKMIEDVNARIDTFHPDAKGREAKESDDLDKDRLSEQEKLERFLGGGI